MALFNSTDDAQRGAPHAICPHDDAICYLAPADCILVAGSNPHVYEFHRHHYYWLAFALAGVEGASSASLERVFYGTHTLRWDAMHEIIARALLNGFAPSRPSGFASVIRDAMFWSQAHQDKLHPITIADFEPLPLRGPRRVVARNSLRSVAGGGIMAAALPRDWLCWTVLGSTLAGPSFSPSPQSSPDPGVLVSIFHYAAGTLRRPRGPFLCLHDAPAAAVFLP